MIPFIGKTIIVVFLLTSDYTSDYRGHRHSTQSTEVCCFYLGLFLCWLVAGTWVLPQVSGVLIWLSQTWPNSAQYLLSKLSILTILTWFPKEWHKRSKKITPEEILCVRMYISIKINAHKTPLHREFGPVYFFLCISLFSTSPTSIWRN